MTTRTPIKKLVAFAGYKVEVHVCLEKDPITGDFVKFEKLKAHDQEKIRSIEIEPINHYKPWEDKLECLRLIDYLDSKYIINLFRDKSGKWKCSLYEENRTVIVHEDFSREVAVFKAIDELLSRC